MILLRTLAHDSTLQHNLQQTPYYDDQGWQLFESVREDLRVVFQWMKDTHFDDYWKQVAEAKVNDKISEIEKNLPQYNVIGEVEKLLGFPVVLESNHRIYALLLATTRYQDHRHAFPD